ncbi:MAG: phage holin family protein [Coriobacteriia bacterium]|nr:phage holin family protein [Coriobacteriia bacterium]
MKFWVRWLITAIAVAFTVWIMPDHWMHIDPNSSSILALAVISVILAFLNVFIRPMLKFFSCGLMVVTLGLFSFVINALLLLCAAWISRLFGIGFYVNGFWPAFWGGLIISFVTAVLSLFVKDDDHSEIRTL